MKLFLQDELILPNCLFSLHENAKTKGECNTCHMWILYMPHVRTVQATCTDCTAYMYTSYKPHVPCTRGLYSSETLHLFFSIAALYHLPYYPVSSKKNFEKVKNTPKK